jgi:serine/threonine-protein kinase
LSAAEGGTEVDGPMHDEQLLQPTQTADTKIGMILQDRYRIVRQLGEGGMGAVYEGEHLLIKKRVAIKCLHAQYAQNPEVVARFHREALAATSIGHQNIIEVTDLGRFPDGSVFMVLEFLPGRDFARLIDDEGPQPLGRVVHIMSQICDALTAAHAKEIVHRDLKPENVFLIKRGDDNDFVKLLDFGISKMKSSGDTPGANMTRTGMALGTPYYMAPEQAQGRKDVDHRADIYALGVILFRALTGQHPFEHDSYPMLVLKICTEPPPPLRRYRPDLPIEIEQIAARMLAKTPEERFQDCAAIKAALKPYEGHSDVPIVNEVARNDALPLASIAGYAATGYADSSPGARAQTPQPQGMQTPQPQGTPGQQRMLETGTPLATQTIVGIPGASKLPIYLGIGVVVLLALAGAGVVASGALSSNPGNVPPAVAVVAPPTAPIAPVPTQPQAGTAPAPTERNVNIRISTTPPNAELLIDGRRRANPFNAQLPYSEEMHTVEVRSPGFMTVMQDLDLSLTQEISIPLERGTGTQDRRVARTRAAAPGAAGTPPQTNTPPEVVPPPVAAGAGAEPPPQERRPPPPEQPTVVRPPPLEEPPPPNPDLVAPPPPRNFKKLSF